MKPKNDRPRGASVRISSNQIEVKLRDGRTIITPLEWYPRLLRATPVQRKAWQWLGDGVGITWEAIDEDLSIQGMLDGNPAWEYQQAAGAVHA
jgi:hypothetical protein